MNMLCHLTTVTRWCRPHFTGNTRQLALSGQTMVVPKVYGPDTLRLESSGNLGEYRSNLLKWNHKRKENSKAQLIQFQRITQSYLSDSDEYYSICHYVKHFPLQSCIHACRHPKDLKFAYSKFHSTLYICRFVWLFWSLRPTSAGSVYPCDVWVNAPSLWIKGGLLTFDWLSPIMGPLLWGRPTQAEGGPAWGPRSATLRIRGCGTVTQRYGDISPDLR